MSRLALIVSPPLDPEGPSVPVRHPPLQSLTIAAGLKALGWSVRVWDLYPSGGSWKKLMDTSLRPDVVVVVYREYDRPSQEKTLRWSVEHFRRAYPEARMVLAGSRDEEEGKNFLSKYRDFEAAFHDLPEWTIPRYLWGEDAEKGSVIRGLEGRGELAPLEVSLDDLPFPAWETVGGPARYNHGAPHRYLLKPYAPVLALRGCPNRCTFCDSSAFACSTPLRVRRPRKVVEEVRYLQARYGVREIQFAEPLFNWNRDWVLEMCDRLGRLHEPVAWSCHVRMDSLDEELLGRMVQAGCWNILFGVESTNVDVLNAANKPLDIPQVFHLVKAASRMGCQTTASFVFGLPLSTEKTIRQTIEDAIYMEPDYAQFFLHKSVSGEPMHEGDRVLSGFEVRANEIPGRLYLPKGIASAEQLRELQREAYRRFYLRPNYILRRTRSLLKPGQIARLFDGVSRLGGLLKP